MAVALTPSHTPRAMKGWMNQHAHASSLLKMGSDHENNHHCARSLHPHLHLLESSPILSHHTPPPAMLSFLKQLSPSPLTSNTMDTLIPPTHPLHLTEILTQVASLFPVYRPERWSDPCHCMLTLDQYDTMEGVLPRMGGLNDDDRELHEYYFTPKVHLTCSLVNKTWQQVFQAALWREVRLWAMVEANVPLEVLRKQARYFKVIHQWGAEYSDLEKQKPGWTPLKMLCAKGVTDLVVSAEMDHKGAEELLLLPWVVPNPKLWKAGSLLCPWPRLTSLSWLGHRHYSTPLPLDLSTEVPTWVRPAEQLTRLRLSRWGVHGRKSEERFVRLLLTRFTKLTWLALERIHGFEGSFPLLLPETAESTFEHSAAAAAATGVSTTTTTTSTTTTAGIATGSSEPFQGVRMIPVSLTTITFLRLHFQSANSPKLIEIVKCCPNLSTLEVIGLWNKDPNGFVKHPYLLDMYKYCPALSALKLEIRPETCSYREVHPRDQDLAELIRGLLGPPPVPPRLGWGSRPLEESIGTSPHPFPSTRYHGLQELHLEVCDFSGPSTYQAILSTACQTLQVLRFSLMRRYEPFTFSNTWTRAMEADVLRRSMQNLTRILQKCPRLKHLQVMHNFSIVGGSGIGGGDEDHEAADIFVSSLPSSCSLSTLSPSPPVSSFAKWSCPELESFMWHHFTHGEVFVGDTELDERRTTWDPATLKRYTSADRPELSTSLPRSAVDREPFVVGTGERQWVKRVGFKSLEVATSGFYGSDQVRIERDMSRRRALEQRISDYVDGMTKLRVLELQGVPYMRRKRVGLGK